MALGFSDSFWTLNLLGPGALYSPFNSKFLDHKVGYCGFIRSGLGK